MIVAIKINHLPKLFVFPAIPFPKYHCIEVDVLKANLDRFRKTIGGTKKAEDLKIPID